MKNLQNLFLPALALSLGIFSNSFADPPPSSSFTKMYWTDFGTDKIQRADLDGSNVEDLVTTGLNSPIGIALDLTNSKMYWTDFGTDKIQRSDSDGSNVEDLVATGLSTPRGIELDLTNSKMYWIDDGTNKIQRSDLDGSNVEDLVTTGLSAPYEIALDLTNSKMYWTDFATKSIRRSDLDGSNVENLVTTGLGSPRGIALDLTNSKIYWTDAGTSKIQRSDLDGSNVEDLVTTGLNFPYGIALDLTNSKMYWTDDGTNKIQRSDLDGSNVEDLVTTGLSVPFGIALGPADAPLSVELNSFSARQIENSIQLNWSTASETENEGFNIYRKTSEYDFVQIASYKTHFELRGQGNTSVETFYTFTDNSKLQSGETYTYVISDVETNGIETKHDKNAQSVTFEAIQNQAVKRFELAQNFPNPFNPSTTISYQIAKDSRVNLKIYNEKGEFVKELTNKFQHEGSHNAVWDGKDENGKSVSSGTYFYKLTAGTFTQTNKMILLK